MNVFKIKIYIRLCFYDNSLKLREFLRSLRTVICVFMITIYSHLRV